MFDFIYGFSPTIAGRYKRLTASGKQIADAGIMRHVRSCEVAGCDVDRSVIYEIVVDAAKGLAIYADNDAESRNPNALQNHSPSMVEHKISPYFSKLRNSF